KLPTDAQAARLSELDREIEKAKQALAAVTDDALAAGRGRWEAEVKARDAAKEPFWTPVIPSEARSSGGSTMEVGPDGIVFVSGNLPEWDTYIVTVPAPLDRIAAIRLQALGDERL